MRRCLVKNLTPRLPPKRGVGLEPTNPRSCSPGPCQLEYPLKKIGRLRGIIAALQKLDTVYCEKPALCFLKTS